MRSGKIKEDASALLWFSYQRYALLAWLGAAVLMTFPVLVLHASWWSLFIALVPSLAFVSLAIHIHRQYSKKLAVTKRAYARIRNGTFEPDSVAKYCSDPCWKVVVAHILGTAGIESSKRRRMLRDFSLEAHEPSATLVMVNREKGVVYVYNGGRLESFRDA